MVIGIAVASMQASAQPAPGALPLPVRPSCVTSPFGPRKPPGPHAIGFHNGIDLRAPEGAPVYAVASGKVVQIRRLALFGLELDLLHDDDADHRYVSRYAHLGTIAPKLAAGQRTVARGEILGRIGRSGITYGTHLFFEVLVDGKPVDPEPLFAVLRCKH